MKKVKQYKGFVIAELNAKEQKETSYKFNLFTKDEWDYGPDCRTAEWEADNLQECLDFIDSY